jgi:lipopolysaccharide/colanic/teichoic acid biosynthesis glycosyltransferase
MNGSAQKTRRWTKGGSLPRPAPAAAVLQPSTNSSNGTADKVTPFLRAVVLGLFSSELSAASVTSLDGSVASEPKQSTKVLSIGSETPPAARVDEGSVQQIPVRIPRWKRILDLALVFLSLPLWLPLMTLVMLLIKVGSPGPIFYRQERVGYRRKLFMIFKFRSMQVNAETGSHERHFANLMGDNTPMTKLDAAGDPRLIPLGRLFRASGLDELPQIFNVIRGDMSLVGPRPCLPYEFQRYEPWQQERVNAAPGLTGYWQVNGKNRTTFGEMIAMDIFYSKNMSLWLDLTIMIKTPPAIVQQVLEAQTRMRNQNVPPMQFAGERQH